MILAVVQEKMLALAEFAVGSGFSLGTFSATLNGPGGTGYQPKGVRVWGLHADQPKYNASLSSSDSDAESLPYDRNYLLTCCIIASDGYSVKTGATGVVPSSHKLLRYPTQEEQDNCEDITEPIIANRGDVACWNGTVWHAFGVRQIPGERVVLHVTYNRAGLEVVDNYDEIPDSAFAGKPYEKTMMQLLRRGGEKSKP
jgi:ectoine hydroxylase-related dioxygenase (phytanoyl-CoA dioxygenase family)